MPSTNRTFPEKRFSTCFGLNWSGVIDDERVATYSAAPLTMPETPVEFGE